MDEFSDAELSSKVLTSPDTPNELSGIAALNKLHSDAENGVPEAQVELALVYADGSGQHDDELSRIWLHKAAEQGDVRAQCYLAWLYSIRLKDEGLSFYWFLRAAEQGDADAQFNVGVCYEEGVGVNQDYALALEWYGKAAGQNQDGAIFRLGRMYENGLGVSLDRGMAAHWYRKAAQLGHAQAQDRLQILEGDFHPYG